MDIKKNLQQQGDYNITYKDVKVSARTNHHHPRVIRKSIEIIKNNNYSFNLENGYRLSNTRKLGLQDRHTRNSAVHQTRTAMDEEWDT